MTARVQTAPASFAVCAMPLPVLASLQVAHFADDVKKAMAAVPYAAAGKIGLQFSRRFWEEDDRIFGGISKTDQDITQIVYPSSNYLGRKGVLVGYYQNGAKAAEMARRTPAERLEVALVAGRADSPAVSQDVRERLRGVVAERPLEPRRLGAVFGRRRARPSIRSSCVRTAGSTSPAITSAT